MDPGSINLGFPFPQELFNFKLQEPIKEKLENGILLKENHKQENFNCEYSDCQKLFKSKKSLRDHIRIHKGEKPYTWLEYTYFI